MDDFKRQLEVQEQMTEAICCSIFHYDLKRFPEPWELEVLKKFVRQYGWTQGYIIKSIKRPGVIEIDRRKY